MTRVNILLKLSNICVKSYSITCTSLTTPEYIILKDIVTYYALNSLKLKK